MKGKFIESTLSDGRVVEVAVIELDETTRVIVAQDGSMLGVMNRTEQEALDDFFEMYEKEILNYEIVE